MLVLLSHKTMSVALKSKVAGFFTSILHEKNQKIEITNLTALVLPPISGNLRIYLIEMQKSVR